MREGSSLGGVAFVLETRFESTLAAISERMWTMFLSVSSALMIGAGVVLIILAKPIVRLFQSQMGNRVTFSERKWTLLYEWPVRLIGLMIAGAGLLSMTTGPP